MTADQKQKATLEGLREAMAHLWLELGEARWDLDVVLSEEDHQSAVPLAEFDVEGHGVLKAFRTDEGTLWRYPDRRSEDVPASVTTHTWSLTDGGESFETKLHAVDLGPAANVWRGYRSLLRVVEGECAHRATDVAEALVADLTQGQIAEALQQGHAAFEEGADTEDETESLIAHALRIRNALDEAVFAIASRGDDVSALQAAINDADAIHAKHESAVLLLDEEFYYDIFDELPTEGTDWRYTRFRLDAHVPAFVVASGLEALEEKPVAKVFSLAEARQKRTASAAVHDQKLTRLAAATFAEPSVQAEPESPCAWWRGSSEPRPGCVPVLLLNDAAQAGVIAELRITVEEDVSEASAWRAAEALRLCARRAIRDAYYATAAITPLGAAPHPFGAHRIELVVDRTALKDASLSIEGASLGLAAASAFASLWLGQPVPSNAVCCATVGGRRYLGQVRGLEEKIRAAASNTADLRVLVAEGSETLSLESGKLVRVAEVRAALSELGLDFDGFESRSYGSIRDRKRTMDGLVDDVRNGDRKKHNDSWSQLGDSLRRVAATLLGEESCTSEATEALCYAALAFSHAGELGEVTDILRSLSRPEGLGVELCTLYDIVRVNQLIDEEKLANADGHTALEHLESGIAALATENPESDVRGSALGTLGRAYMHQRMLAQALPLLEQAVVFHQRHYPYEVPRSRVYLAMCQRMLGDLDQASEQLARADRELATKTRNYSYEYEESTRVYLEYERAREFVEQNNDRAALAATDAALAGAPIYWWPTLGILRTRAWALTSLGLQADADACVSEMEALSVPPDSTELQARFVDEAKGPVITDGLVY